MNTILRSQRSALGWHLRCGMRSRPRFLQPFMAHVSPAEPGTRVGHETTVRKDWLVTRLASVRRYASDPSQDQAHHRHLVTDVQCTSANTRFLPHIMSTPSMPSAKGSDRLRGYTTRSKTKKHSLRDCLLRQSAVRAHSLGIFKYLGLGHISDSPTLTGQSSTTIRITVVFR